MFLMQKVLIPGGKDRGMYNLAADNSGLRLTSLMKPYIMRIM